LQVTTCFNYDDVFATVQENMKAFMKKDGPGVVCMAYSCLLSRGIEQVAADMDSNFGMAPKMIGNHGCVQAKQQRAKQQRAKRAHLIHARGRNVPPISPLSHITLGHAGEVALHRTLARTTHSRTLVWFLPKYPSSPITSTHARRYANQEFVNLFITGRATSNLFDGQKKFADDTGASEDEIIMGGIGERGDVGFLTLFEAFKSLEVGVHLKVPVCPIWVVCSESHYSTLFSVRAKDVNVDEAEQVRKSGERRAKRERVVANKLLRKLAG